MANEVDQSAIAAARQHLLKNRPLWERLPGMVDEVIEVMAEYASERESLAVEREREECAKIALRVYYTSECNRLCWSIYEAIRSRASQPAQVSNPIASVIPECAEPCEDCRWHDCAGRGSCGCKCHNPEPQGGKEAHAAPRNQTTEGPATGASSSSASGLLASPHCPKCGSDNLALAHDDRRVGMFCHGCETLVDFQSPSDLAPFFLPSPESRRELAARIAQRAWNWHFSPEMNPESEPSQRWRKELAEIVEEELSR